MKTKKSNEIFLNINKVYENSNIIFIPVANLIKKWSISKTKKDEELYNDYKKQNNEIIGLLIYKKDKYWFWIKNSYESDEENSLKF